MNEVTERCSDRFGSLTPTEGSKLYLHGEPVGSEDFDIVMLGGLSFDESAHAECSRHGHLEEEPQADGG